MTEGATLEVLTPEECWDYLRHNSVGRLAVAVAGRPDIFPVNYRLDDDAILVKTAPGFKLAAATLGPAVAFEIDQVDRAERSGWSVVVHGVASEIEKIEELLEADDLELAPWAGGHKNRYIRIVPEEITGRRIPPQQ